MNIIYARVSKENETEQDLDRQIEVVKTKFGLVDPIIFSERVSAYNIDKFEKRTEFIKMLEFLIGDTKIIDIYKGKIKANKQLNLYVYDYNRISRLLEYNLLFSILCDIFKVTIHSYNQRDIIKKDSETVRDKFSRYMFSSIHAFASEDYSENISNNVKKSVRSTGNVTYAEKNGIKKTWGRGLKDIEGNKLSVKETESIIKLIIRRIDYYESNGYSNYYDKIVEAVKEGYDVEVSKAYLSKIKKRLENEL